MKYLAQTLPLEGKGAKQTLRIGDLLNLSVRWTGRRSDTGRELALVVPADDNSTIGGYIGLSKGPDGYHIGSPTENTVLRKVADEQNWKRI